MLEPEPERYVAKNRGNPKARARKRRRLRKKRSQTYHNK